MDTVLLATKLRIPPQPQRALRRTRLIDAIEHGIPHHKLVQIAAPTGYGKTTLLVQWARASRFPIAWLSLGAEDNDVERFLLTAWEAIQPGIRESPVGLLLGGLSPDSEAVLSAFINRQRVPGCETVALKKRFSASAVCSGASSSSWVTERSPTISVPPKAGH